MGFCMHNTLMINQFFTSNQSYVHSKIMLLNEFIVLIAPKASAEGACILSKMGYYFRVWLVTEIVVCVVTVMLWYMGHT